MRPEIEKLSSDIKEAYGAYGHDADAYGNISDMELGERSLAWRKARREQELADGRKNAG